MLLASCACGSLMNSPCPKCGDVDVPFPLSTRDGCGDSRYRVYCNDNALEFMSLSGSYYKIISINPSAYKLVISTPKIGKHACCSSDLKDGGFKIDESSPFNISNHNTVMLFNCSENILLSPLNCSSNSLCRVWEEEVGGEESPCMSTLCCSFRKDASITSHRIRVRIGGCTAYTSVVDLRPDQTPSMWNYGIELQWVPPSAV
ncbi:hypothetical protein ACLOJK_026340 [Asimina triloba]